MSQLVTNTTQLENMLFRLGRGKFINVTTDATPGTEVAVSHGLTDENGNALVPKGYIVCGQDKAGSLFDGTTANTDALIHFRSDIASVAALVYIFG